MYDEKYNGWANYATWNLALWWDNAEGLYRLKCNWLAAAHVAGQTVTGDQARAFVTAYTTGDTPDMRSRDLGPDDVCWDEIARTWDEEKQEQSDYIDDWELHLMAVDMAYNLP